MTAIYRIALLRSASTMAQVMWRFGCGVAILSVNLAHDP
jgi:hypothetical protein